MTMPWEVPPVTDIPRVAFMSGERLAVMPVRSPTDEYTLFTFSAPIPGKRSIAMLEVYYNTMLVVTLSDTNKYTIHRTNDFQTFSLVHTHDTEIYGIFKISPGHAIFSAEDGWWETTDTGDTWTQLSADGPKARAAVITGHPDLTSFRAISAYGEDRKLYYYELPSDTWEMAYDTEVTGVWYPALDGAHVGLLAGAGNMLLVSTDMGKTWAEKTIAGGIIKHISATDKSAAPAFLIAVETPASDSSPSPEGQCKLYWSYDLGDSLAPDVNRIDPAISVSSVFPTGGDARQITMSVMGRKSDGSSAIFSLMNVDGDY